MTLEYQNKSIALQQRIFDEDYYLRWYLTALAKHGMSTASIDQHEHSKEELCSMWNTFWLLLPDTKHIQRAPFSDLCDLAEAIFDDGAPFVDGDDEVAF